MGHRPGRRPRAGSPVHALPRLFPPEPHGAIRRGDARGARHFWHRPGVIHTPDLAPDAMDNGGADILVCPAMTFPTCWVGQTFFVLWWHGPTCWPVSGGPRSDYT